MKIKLLFAAALMALCAPVAAIDIDITNHPDKDFLLGYRHSYPGDCDAMWWASKWNTEHIMGVGECDGISDEKAMADMNSLMSAIKNLHPEFNNFSEYFRWKNNLTEKVNREAKAQTMPSPGYPRQFCVDGEEHKYFFADVHTSLKPGWKRAYKRRHGGEKLEDLGFWQVSMHGEVILTAGSLSTVIPPAGTYPCGNVISR